MIAKFFWTIRAILYFPFFGTIKFPSYIGKPIIIKGCKNIFIGKHVRIFPQIRLETHGVNGSITINDDVSVGQNVHITSGSNLIIGKSTTILANVFITNIDHDYQEIGVHILKQKYLINETLVGENCFIGIGACIQAGTILGKQCIVGANSVVKGIYPDYCVIAGVPAKILKRYNFNSKVWERTYPDGTFLEK
ncbi:acyltransferase [Flavobacterium sp. AC]|uniref:Acyltransferase n=1 Tax=Flavobacterium azizsancarii TaxID=2961580 RepID=A0ABT4W8C2_9FLAO|nr:DapH/DapD/GlmU-related protein [Flavobacterium azizsancarii]MDA6068805.1 acyltransferase [Flavobacterium azizsancarii]